jgi:hypothetical protein
MQPLIDYSSMLGLAWRWFMVQSVRPYDVSLSWAFRERGSGEREDGGVTMHAHR